MNNETFEEIISILRQERIEDASISVHWHFFHERLHFKQYIIDTNFGQVTVTNSNGNIIARLRLTRAQREDISILATVHYNRLKQEKDGHNKNANDNKDRNNQSFKRSKSFS